MATLRPKDSKSPEKASRGHEAAREDSAASQISRARTCDTGMMRLPRLAESRANEAQ